MSAHFPMGLLAGARPAEGFHIGQRHSPRRITQETFPLEASGTSCSRASPPRAVVGPPVVTVPSWAASLSRPRSPMQVVNSRDQPPPQTRWFFKAPDPSRVSPAPRSGSPTLIPRAVSPGTVQRSVLDTRPFAMQANSGASSPGQRMVPVVSAPLSSARATLAADVTTPLGPVRCGGSTRWAAPTVPPVPSSKPTGLSSFVPAGGSHKLPQGAVTVPMQVVRHGQSAVPDSGGVLPTPDGSLEFGVCTPASFKIAVCPTVAQGGVEDQRKSAVGDEPSKSQAVPRFGRSAQGENSLFVQPMNAQEFKNRIAAHADTAKNALAGVRKRSIIKSQTVAAPSSGVISGPRRSLNGKDDSSAPKAREQCALPDSACGSNLPSVEVPDLGSPVRTVRPSFGDGVCDKGPSSAMIAVISDGTAPSTPTVMGSPTGATSCPETMSLLTHMEFCGAPSTHEAADGVAGREEDAAVVETSTATDEAQLNSIRKERDALRRQCDRMLETLREMEADRERSQQKATAASKRCGELEKENASLNERLSQQQRRQEELELEVQVVTDKLGETHLMLEESHAQCDLLRQLALDVREQLRPPTFVCAKADWKLKDDSHPPRVQPTSAVESTGGTAETATASSGWPSPRTARSEASARGVDSGGGKGDTVEASSSPSTYSSCLQGGSTSAEAPLLATSTLEEVPPSPFFRPRVLVTGATGLLGRQLLKALQDSWEVKALGFRRARHPVIACDVTEVGAVARQIEEFQPNVVVHLAAERRPEILSKDPQKAEVLNVVTTGEIARACHRRGCWLVLLSTDHVFEGTNPPFTVDAPPMPLSEYGKQKLKAESMTLAACPSAAILRVPMMYGPVDNLEECAVTNLYADLTKGVKTVDDGRLLYPTWAGDIAGVLWSMIDLYFAGTALQGIYHWQGREQLSKYEMMRLVAELTGFDASSLVPIGRGADSSRQDALQLDCSRLEDLIGSDMFRTPFRVGLAICLAPYKPAQTQVRRSNRP